ncbi:ribosomal protein S18-alanine N-acetyltransferase [Pannus brasiliensis CCIBt3594]|uniref:Ribosomal protein S18-alanine N-acetyltransferase n=1 Tax=Pannus brasiliensis CCIBt3594 TaxID=1427578 RepID=A0AAW9QJ99_9CHRO
MSLQKLYLQQPNAEHLEAIVALDRTCLGGIWSLEGYRRELDSPNSYLLVLSLSDNPESIIGCGCFWAILEEAHITIIAIHPDYQGRGLGKLLLFRLLEEAVRRRLERATLEVRVSNQVAIALYDRFGFQVAGRRKNYYPQTGEDALILWRGDLQKPDFAEQLDRWREEIAGTIDRRGWRFDGETQDRINTTTTRCR